MLASRNQQRPDHQLGRKEREVLAVELDRYAEDAVSHGVRQARRSYRPESRPLSFPRLHAYGNHGYDQLLQRWSAVVERKVPSGFEHTAASRKHKIEIGVITERRSGHADATSGGRAAAPNPTAPMQLDLIAPRPLNPHGLVAIGRKEKVTVVGRQHTMFDAGRGELAKRAGQIVDDGIHDLAGLEREPALARMIDLLRTYDHDLGALDLLR